MQIDEELKSDLKSDYNAWAETKRNVKELNHGNSELLKNVAQKLGVEKSEASAAFKFAFRLEEEGKDELDGIVDVFSTLRS